MMRNGMKQILGAGHPMLQDPVFTRRPEQLSISEFIELTNRVEEAMKQK
jgi:16S rRNA (adenine1518-N6/adenine1519-N6)-dimethyltransferase